MKYRKWDPKTKAKIVLEGLQRLLRMELMVFLLIMEILKP
jgi:hypothetical protein